MSVLALFGANLTFLPGLRMLLLNIEICRGKKEVKIGNMLAGMYKLTWLLLKENQKVSRVIWSGI